MSLLLGVCPRKMVAGQGWGVPRWPWPGGVDGKPVLPSLLEHSVRGQGGRGVGEKLEFSWSPTVRKCGLVDVAWAPGTLVPGSWALRSRSRTNYRGHGRRKRFLGN